MSKNIRLIIFAVVFVSCASQQQNYKSRTIAAFDRKSCANIISQIMHYLPGGERLYLFAERKYQKHFLVTDNFLDASGESIKFVDRKLDEPLELRFGDVVGVGQYGSVYHVKEMRNSETKKFFIEEEENLIVKIGNRKKGDSLLDESEFNFGIEEEGFFYNKFDEGVKSMWSDGKLDQYSEVMEYGRFPAVPIVYHLQGEAGDMLIKPFVKGRSIKQLKEKLKSDGSLPSKYIEGLREIFELSQLVHNNVRTEASPVDSELMRYSLDLKPTNLFWVKSKKAMKKLGLKKPGFVLIEADHLPQKRWKYRGRTVGRSGMSFEDYLQLFMKYINDIE